MLEEQRELWDASADIKAFFFPGPPTSYSAALSRRRSEQLKEVRQDRQTDRQTDGRKRRKELTRPFSVLKAFSSS